MNRYEKYIHTGVPEELQRSLKPPKRILEQREKGIYVDSTWLFHLPEDVVKGAFYTSGVWLWEKHGNSPIEMEIAHTHDFDETIGFLGTVRDDPHSLGGEIEFWLEDERYILDKSCILFIPRGMKHLPLYINRLDSPIFHWTAGNGGTYGRTSGNEA